MDHQAAFTAIQPKRSLCILLTFLLISAICCFERIEVQAASYGVINASNVNLRKAPRMSAKILNRLKKNTTVQILGKSGSWYKVKASGRNGYVMKKYVAAVPSRIVTTTTAKYTPAIMKKQLGQLASRYKERMMYFEFGTSTWETPLYCAVVGNPSAKRKILIDGGTHAREYMTAQLLMLQIEQLCVDYNTKKYGGRLYKNILEDCAIYFIPMLNPDGTSISQSGISGVPASWKRFIKSVPFTSDCPSFKRWKANGAGIDLNRNYPFGWQKSSIAAGGSGGNKSLEAVEVQALTDLCDSYSFYLAVNYHSQGNILYWRDKYLADRVTKPFMNIIKDKTGYYPVTDSSPNGGFKSWFCYTYKRPSITIEIGNVSCPLPLAQLADVWNRNKLVPIALASYAAKD